MYAALYRGGMSWPILRAFDWPTAIQTQIKENIKAPRHWPLWGPVPHKGPVTRKMFPFDDVIILLHVIWILTSVTIYVQRPGVISQRNRNSNSMKIPFQFQISSRLQWNGRYYIYIYTLLAKSNGRFCLTSKLIWQSFWINMIFGMCKLGIVERISCKFHWNQTYVYWVCVF